MKRNEKIFRLQDLEKRISCLERRNTDLMFYLLSTFSPSEKYKTIKYERKNKMAKKPKKPCRPK